MKISRNRVTGYLKSLFINNYIIGEVKKLNNIIKIDSDMVRIAAPNEVIVVVEEENPILLSSYIKSVIYKKLKVSKEEDLWTITDEVLMKMKEIDCAVSIAKVSILFEYAGVTCIYTSCILEDEELGILIDKVVESVDIKSLGIKESSL